jgi:hypothetical protein
MIQEENAPRQIYSHAKVPLKTWQNYKIYLSSLAEKVEKIRFEYLVSKEKVNHKFHSKFRGYTHFGDLINNLTMKTEEEDYFRLKNIINFFKKKLEGSVITNIT